MRVLSNADVAALLPMEQAIEVVDRVMRHVSDGGAQMPLRHVVPVGEANGMGVMSGAIGAPDCYGVNCPHCPSRCRFGSGQLPVQIDFTLAAIINCTHK